MSNKDSYKDIFQFWLTEIDTYKEKHSMVMIVGNKKDLGNKFETDELEVSS